ncbi:hypothetical protein PLICRDRAFT_55516 [Plicaturopsis crispa FD-325 SS-3]|nr:hypothetical protein PLICRDRAFT_55516 [Plicaturopsis crispa FD-325 SS-3]
MTLFFKLALLSLSSIGMHMAGTSPNPPASPAERIRIARWREIFLTSARIAIVVKTLFLFSGIAEVAVLLAEQYPGWSISSRVLSALVPHAHSRIHITPLFVFGSLLTLAGGLIRFLCYRTLGRFFTFELSIRSNHRLVKSGPYSLVRHPGYTGTIFTLSGALCCHGTSGSWIRECGILETTAGQIVASVWVVAVLSIMGSLFLRMPKEDEMLKKEFGKEWEQWRRDVRYRLIPGVY